MIALKVGDPRSLWLEVAGQATICRQTVWMTVNAESMVCGDEVREDRR